MRGNVFKIGKRTPSFAQNDYVWPLYPPRKGVFRVEKKMLLLLFAMSSRLLSAQK